ncbi:MAG: hypothetical protein LBE17_10985 [Treponema sp.]|jgi:hypothetical protein|nr:hypothetical protein [Treponema sp.]
MSKASLAQEAVGKKPTDRGKKRKQTVSSDGWGEVPLALVVIGANRHDVSQREVMLDSFQIERPDMFETFQHLCRDKGYSGEPVLEIVVSGGFIPHIKGCG